MEKNKRNAIVGPVVANFVYGWRIRFLYKRTLRRFWPLVLLVKTDVQRELGLRWGVIGRDDKDAEKYLPYFGDRDKYDTGGMAYQQFAVQRRYKYVRYKFHKEIKHFGGMTWMLKNKIENANVKYNIDNTIVQRNLKLDAIKEILTAKAY